jgi:hypothetical protein
MASGLGGRRNIATWAFSSQCSRDWRRDAATIDVVLLLVVAAVSLLLPRLADSATR